MEAQHTAVLGKILRFPAEFMELVSRCQSTGLVTSPPLSDIDLTLAFLRFSGCQVESPNHDVALAGGSSDMSAPDDKLPVRDTFAHAGGQREILTASPAKTDVDIRNLVSAKPSVIEGFSYSRNEREITSPSPNRVVINGRQGRGAQATILDFSLTASDIQPHVETGIQESTSTGNYSDYPSIWDEESFPGFPQHQSTSNSGSDTENSDDKTQDEEPWVQSYSTGESSVVDLPRSDPRGRRRPVNFVGNNLEDYECPTCVGLPTMERPYVWYNRGCSQKKHFVCYLCVLELLRNVRNNRVRKPDFPFNCHTCRGPWLVNGFVANRIPEHLVSQLRSSHVQIQSENRTVRAQLRHAKRQEQEKHAAGDPDRLRYSCNKCPKSFSHRPGLSLHNRMVHEKLKFSCPHCEKEFCSQQSVDKHVRSICRRRVRPNVVTL